MKEPHTQPVATGTQEPDLEHMCAAMAAALKSLDCPECCGPTYEFIEFGARIHNEELEWACLLHAVRKHYSRGNGPA